MLPEGRPSTAWNHGDKVTLGFLQDLKAFKKLLCGAAQASLERTNNRRPMTVTLITEDR